MALYVLSLFGSVLLHELGHSLAARRYGIQDGRNRDVSDRRCFAAGAAAQGIRRVLDCARRTGGEPLDSAGAPGNRRGPAGVDSDRAAAHPTDANLISVSHSATWFCALFNLLPAYPMDGGRILRSFLARWRTEEEATRIAASSGQIMAMLMGLAGLLSGNFLLVFVAMFVYLGAMQEGSAVRSRLLTSGFPVRAAMITDFRTLQHGQTIRDAGELLLATSQHDFPVMQGDSPAGLLTRRP